ncbi:hypothetical protein [Arthrobacter sp. MDT1-65]
MEIPVLAGSLSTVLFALATLPMLLKAVRTRDLSSYSLSNIVISNIANAVHSVYVFSLPFGPIWMLHSFYVVASALMLGWCFSFRAGRSAAPGRRRVRRVRWLRWLRQVLRRPRAGTVVTLARIVPGLVPSAQGRNSMDA